MLVDVANGLADQACGFKHIGRVPQRAVGFVTGLRLQQLHDRLADRQIARSHQHDGALACDFEYGHFTKTVDQIDTGIGARIR